MDEFAGEAGAAMCRVWALAGGVLLAGCASDPCVNAQTRGAVGGTVIGAIIGNCSRGIGQGKAMIADALIGALLSENELRKQNPPRRY